MATYVQQIKNLRTYEKTTIYVDYHHVFIHDETLASTIQSHFYRYGCYGLCLLTLERRMEPYMKKAVQNLVKKYDLQYLTLKSGSYAGEDANMREFWVSFYNFNPRKRCVLQAIELR